MILIANTVGSKACYITSWLWRGIVAIRVQVLTSNFFLITAYVSTIYLNICTFLVWSPMGCYALSFCTFYQDWLKINRNIPYVTSALPGQLIIDGRYGTNYRWTLHTYTSMTLFWLTVVANLRWIITFPKPENQLNVCLLPDIYFAQDI